MIKVTVANDRFILKEVSKRLVNKLREKSIDNDIIFDIHVSFEEALRNAMIHGNKSDTARKITISVTFSDSLITISVEDEGAGFEPDKLPDPTMGENLLKENGRGVYLIKHLMDEVKFEKNGARIIMSKHTGRKRL